jgi:hypothetical protein
MNFDEMNELYVAYVRKVGERNSLLYNAAHALASAGAQHWGVPPDWTDDQGRTLPYVFAAAVGQKDHIEPLTPDNAVYEQEVMLFTLAVTLHNTRETDAKAQITISMAVREYEGGAQFCVTNGDGEAASTWHTGTTRGILLVEGELVAHLA